MTRLRKMTLVEDFARRFSRPPDRLGRGTVLWSKETRPATAHVCSTHAFSEYAWTNL
jgi:hypothetical protein